MDDFCIPQGNRHIAMMPLRKNVPYPLNDSWKLMACPVCGQRCWLQTDKLDILKLINPRVEFRCTECAMEAQKQADNPHGDQNTSSNRKD